MTEAQIQKTFERMVRLAESLAELENRLPNIDRWCDVVGESAFGDTPARALLKSAKWFLRNPDLYGNKL